MTSRPGAQLLAQLNRNRDAPLARWVFAAAAIADACGLHDTVSAALGQRLLYRCRAGRSAGGAAGDGFRSAGRIPGRSPDPSHTQPSRRAPCRERCRRHGAASLPWLRVSVRDDGQGFDARAAVGRSRYGLGGMRQRALRLGGQLRIDAAPGTGTRVELWLPMPPARDSVASL